MKKSHDFKEEINNRIEDAKEKRPAPADRIRLEYGGSSLEVRQRGSFITECQLKPFYIGSEVVDILHSDPDITTGKLTASHMMSPVGPSEELGGQHGVARWADWHIFEPTTGRRGEPTVTMQAKRSDLEESLLRTFSLGEHQLTVSSVLYNNSEQDKKVSLGEHFYFPCEEKDISNIKLGFFGYDDDDGETIEQLFGQDKLEGLLDGEPIFWPGFNGYIEIDFGSAEDDLLVRLSSDLTIGSDEAGAKNMVGMLIWHRPGSNSICFEPVVGFWEFPDGTHRNDEVRLPSFDKVELKTSIRV